VAGAIGVVELGDLNAEYAANEFGGEDRVRRAVGCHLTVI
jgi:hypothetical protein